VSATVRDTVRGLTRLERELAPVDHGFVAYWKANRVARARMVRAARLTLGEYRESFGYAREARPLFTPPDAQPKTGKNKVPTFTLMLAPARSVWGNACPAATRGCSDACLDTSGKGGIYDVRFARMVRMGFLVVHPFESGVLLAHEIRAAVRKRGRIGIRLNCVSDIRWELATPVMVATLARHRGVTLYDYTAFPARLRDARPDGYHLTYSAKETHAVEDIRAMLAHGNVAVPFATRRGQELPTVWHGMPVIDGDVTDFRPSDPHGVIVGLRAKGDAIGDASGFVRMP
jgi:hypothetical protein